MIEHSDRENLALVPAGGRFEGQIAILGDTRIEGHVQGSLRGPGRLIVRAGASVEGLVECDSVDCSGRICGPVTTRTHIVLGPGAEFEGDLTTPTLSMDPESVWNGAARIG